MTKQEEQSEIFKKFEEWFKSEYKTEYNQNSRIHRISKNAFEAACNQPPLEGDVKEKPVVRESRMTELMTQEEFTDKHARTNEGRVIKNAAMMYQGYIIGFTKAKQSKPVEGDVGDEAIKVIKGKVMWDKYGDSELKDIPLQADYWSLELARQIYDALLYKYNFTKR